jgi:hypothetical protein
LILGIDFWNEFDIVPYVQCKIPPIHEIYVNATPGLFETEHGLRQDQQTRLSKILESLLLTYLMKHTINIGDVEPVRSRPYEKNKNTWGPILEDNGMLLSIQKKDYL